jgi:hypothetical protein
VSPAPALLVLVSLVVACTGGEPAPDTADAAAPVPAAHAAGTGTVDHIIVAVDSLERGIALLRAATGVSATFGGVHPGRGTQNALMSLGPRTYLELIAPNPADERGPETVEQYAGFRALTPAGWAAQAVDAEAMRAAFVAGGLTDSPVAPGSRVTTSGDTLRWKTIAPWPEGVDWSVLPFFIEWVAPTPHPATSTPSGCTLAGLVVRTPEADTVRSLLRSADLVVDVERADSSGFRFELECPNGSVVIGE